MSVIAGLQDFRQESPPADVGVYQFPSDVLVFEHTFAGTAYICAVRAGLRGWVLVGYLPSAVAANVDAVTQAAVNELGGNPGEVWLGTMNVNKTVAIVLYTGQTLRGVGYGTHITVTANNINAIEVIGTAATHKTDVEISNLRLEGTGAGTGNGIRGDYVDRLIIKTVWITNFGGHGIYLANDLYAIVEGCELYGNIGHGIYVSSDGQRRVISGNIAYGNGGTGFEIMGYANTISGNVAYGNTGNGIQAYNADEVIVGNVCAYNTGRGIYARCDASVVAGNLLPHNDVAGIEVALGDDVAVTGNQCNYNPNGIYVNGSNDVVVSGNQAYGGSQDGCRINNALNTVVVGNRFRGNTGYGVNELGTSNYTLLDGNNLRGNTAGAHTVDALNSLVGDNIV